MYYIFGMKSSFAELIQLILSVWRRDNWLITAIISICCAPTSFRKDAQQTIQVWFFVTSCAIHRCLDLLFRGRLTKPTNVTLLCRWPNWDFCPGGDSVDDFFKWLWMLLYFRLFAVSQPFFFVF
jgi:hypothetical protein